MYGVLCMEQNASSHIKRPFEGIRIIDLTHVIAGPFATYQLGLLGAEVIRVEPCSSATVDPTRMRGGPSSKETEEKMGWCFCTQGGNKKYISINLKDEEGLSILVQLISGADVLVENWKPGKLAKLGLDAKKLEGVNPSLIVCSLSGFGQDCVRGAYDNTIQARSGLLSAGGGKIPCPFIDFSTGWCCAFAISSALLQRERFGRSFQVIDVSMFDVAMTCFSPSFAAFGNQNFVQGAFVEAGMDKYVTSDGKEIMLGVYTLSQNQKLWEVIDVEESLTFACINDVQGLCRLSEKMRAVLQREILKRSSSEWEEIFVENEIPAEIVRSCREALKEAKANSHLFKSNQEVPVSAFSFLSAGPKLETPASVIGAHTNQILTEILGISSKEIESLRARSIVE